MVVSTSAVIFDALLFRFFFPEVKPSLFIVFAHYIFLSSRLCRCQHFMLDDPLCFSAFLCRWSEQCWQCGQQPQHWERPKLREHPQQTEWVSPHNWRVQGISACISFSNHLEKTSLSISDESRDSIFLSRWPPLLVKQENSYIKCQRTTARWQMEQWVIPTLVICVTCGCLSLPPT